MLLLLKLLILIALFYSSSLFWFCGVFFLFSTKLSIMIGLFHSGWLGSMLFLVFVGGMLMILFYLGMFGTYFSLGSKNSFLLMFVFLSFPVFLSKYNFFLFKTGETSFSFFCVFFLLKISIFLYILLSFLSKILGIGSAMRSFF